MFGALGAKAAQAHTDVRWSVSIGLPALPVYVAPAPVYAPPPPPVVYAPAPVYVPPAPVVVYGGAPVRSYYGGNYGGYYGGGYGHRGGHHHGQPQQVRWDRDRDGVPDRWDRRPDNPYRR
ncbi:hypothetical protein QWJ38_02480 [Pelomonas sp. PFR6]|uniref:PXPV repeat-containing protein n=1 Tax=Roseateles violae TaxID=3058042 RepID=A0ABT8DPX4_9BURK|nr:hypothetical protein [Pelomonas sp. PFR6]MDN3919138.1 hypothetical protein [Pelomonas sp. PFR6]